MYSKVSIKKIIYFYVQSKIKNIFKTKIHNNLTALNEMERTDTLIKLNEYI